MKEKLITITNLTKDFKVGKKVLKAVQHKMPAISSLNTGHTVSYWLQEMEKR